MPVNKLRPILWLLATPLLVAPLINAGLTTPVLWIICCLLPVELAITFYFWCFTEDNWPCAFGSSWLFACALGAFIQIGTGFQWGGSRESLFSFIFMMLWGYALLRSGIYVAMRGPSFAGRADNIFRACSPETIAPQNYITLMQTICLVSSLGLLALYFYYDCFPAFTNDPPLFRYKYFNGPYTNALVRFVFRSLSAVSLISLLYLIVFFRHKQCIIARLLSIAVICLAVFCSAANGTRGDIVAIALFSFFMVIFAMKGRKRIYVSIGLLLIFSSAFCAFSASRINQPMSLFHLFPEAFDAALLIDAFHENQTPYALGKTYLSALLSFIPSSLFPFRETYGFGRYSLEILFPDGNIAPTYGGLRPTFVGEAYLNFGIPGVLLVGFFLGFVLGIWRRGIARLRELSGAQVFFFLFSMITVMVSDFYGFFHAYALVIFMVWGMRWLLGKFGRGA